MTNILFIERFGRGDHELSHIGGYPISNVANYAALSKDTESALSAIGMYIFMLQWLTLTEAPIVGSVG